METKKISVCIPAYNRPDMLRQLINSFLWQDYENKELVISDDSPSDSVQKMVAQFKSPCIKYFKNADNLGYSRNLLESMEKSSGEYIVVLGDDDLFLSRSALSRYADIFNSYPGVSYIYSNQAQFSSNLRVEYLFKFFEHDTVFSKGRESMEKIWTTSIFIPGMGIRRHQGLFDFYPKSDMLFPQVEFVGHILNRHDSFGISEFLTAGRAHEEQLGFFAIKNQRIKGGEKHGTVELFDIFSRLGAAYEFNYSDDFLARDLIDRSLFMLLKEKSIVGNERVSFNYKNFCEVSPLAKNSKKLRLSYCVALLTPATAIRTARWSFLKVKALVNRREFNAYSKKLRAIASLASI